MPLSPTDSLKLSDDDLLLLKTIEQEIDCYLALNYDGGEIEVDLTPIIKDTLKQKIKDRLIEDYIEAGWGQAKFKKDGFCLKFILNMYNINDWDK